MTTKAKAWLYKSTKNGIIDDLHLTDYDIPSTQKDHVLVEVLNASLNPGDLKLPKAPIVNWMIKWPASICYDFCGRVKALPAGFVADERNLHVGQIVYGMRIDLKTLGTLRSVMWVHKDSIYPLPRNIAVEHGSALGVGALTAYQAVAPYVKPGAKVLVNGGSGGVGTFCIQIAKELGYYVIATCSEAGAKLCRDLGADEVLDYKASKFLEDQQRTQVDLIVDCVGADTQLHRRSEAFLKPDGQFVLVALMDDTWSGIGSMLASWACPVWLGGPSRKWKAIFTQNKVSDYAPVAKLVEEGKLKVVVDSIFPFKDAPAAFRKLKSGRTKGKIIVDVASHNT